MGKLILAVAPLVMIVLIASYGLAADRRWTALPEGDLKNLPTIRDIVTSGNDVFAVGDMGLFYRYDSDSLMRVHSPRPRPFIACGHAARTRFTLSATAARSSTLTAAR